MKDIIKVRVVIIGIIVLVTLIIVSYFFLFSGSKNNSPAVPCAIGDKFNILTGKPCPLRVEENEPASTSNAVDPYKGRQG